MKYNFSFEVLLSQFYSFFKTNFFFNLDEAILFLLKMLKNFSKTCVLWTWIGLRFGHLKKNLNRNLRELNVCKFRKRFRFKKQNIVSTCQTCCEVYNENIFHKTVQS